MMQKYTKFQGLNAKVVIWKLQLGNVSMDVTEGEKKSKLKKNTHRGQ